MGISKAEAERIETACAEADRDAQRVEDLEGRLVASRNEAVMARQAFDQIAVRRELGEGTVDERDEAAARANRDRAAERVEAVVGALSLSRERAAASRAAVERERTAARWGESSRLAERLRRERDAILAAAGELSEMVEKYRSGAAELAAVSPRSEERRDLVDELGPRSGARMAAAIELTVKLLRRNSAIQPGFDPVEAVGHFLREEAQVITLFGFANSAPDEVPPVEATRGSAKPMGRSHAQPMAKPMAQGIEPRQKFVPAPSNEPRPRVARGMED